MRLPSLPGSHLVVPGLLIVGAGIAGLGGGYFLGTKSALPKSNTPVVPPGVALSFPPGLPPSFVDQASFQGKITAIKGDIATVVDSREGLSRDLRISKNVVVLDPSVKQNNSSSSAKLTSLPLNSQVLITLNAVYVKVNDRLTAPDYQIMTVLVSPTAQPSPH